MAELELYNSASKKKEVFTPLVEGRVGMYVCGVTVYNFSHIGHARAYVAFDLLYRYLRYLDYEVVYVRNFTDIDDKIIREANKGGEDWREFSERFIQEFSRDMADLNCLVPTHQPRVTDHMEQIKAMISSIISRGHAYAVDGDVYFSAADFPGYGCLSGRNPQDSRAGERVGVARKRDPADFALWKGAKGGEPQWDSPWGPGRPGWHIECSAMSAHYLSSTFDIHGGGMDLIFPHHENEIAQSCAASPHSRVNFWMHNGFVTTNNGVKMSKSNSKSSLTIRMVTDEYHPLALRHYLLGTHYRSPLSYSRSQIEIASEAIFYIYQTLQNCQDALAPLDQVQEIKDEAINCINSLHNQVETKLGNDLQTQPILNGALPESLRVINTMLEKQQQLDYAASLIHLVNGVRQVLDLLGLLSNATYAEVLQQLKDKALKRAGLSEEEIFHLIEERRLSRINKDFSRGDEIRDDLASRGITLMDQGKQTLWRPSVPKTTH